MSTEIETRVAATVAGQTPKAIRQEFQQVLKRSAVSAGRARLQLSFRDVIYFCFKKELEQEGISVGPDERRELYSVFRRNVAHSGRWRRDGQQLKRSGNVPVVFDLGQSSTDQARSYAPTGWVRPASSAILRSAVASRFSGVRECRSSRWSSRSGKGCRLSNFAKTIRRWIVQHFPMLR